MRRAAKYLAWTALLLLLVAMAAWGLALGGLKELDSAERQTLGGDYLHTPMGTLSYTRQGAMDAPAVVLVHGFSTPKFVWEQVTPTLLAADYQVITYDHFGRGFSDRPPGPYNSALYQGELAALIAGLQLATPLTLVGYSMGGANVIDYAASFPQQVRQLVLIAPAGYMRNADSLSLLDVPLLGEWLMTVFGRQFAYRGIKAEVDAGRAPATMLEQFERQAVYSGYTDALLSTLRHFPMADLAHRYRIVAGTDIPVTAIWGTDDEIVPYAGAALMAQDLPRLQLTTIEGANHSLTFGQPKRVAAALLQALGSP
ncbi:MAG: alpha/beta hydrolase [Halioglobus sp.]|nr:alpha/beta hydrolase [Halioglobus sp.]